jgi:hypothetical protein
MTKKNILLLIIFLLVPMLPASAAETISVTNTGAAAINIYPSEFDRLVMDFTVKRSDGIADTLKALTLQNNGTARHFYDISKVIVWADAGPVGFQGMEIDEKLGEATRYELEGYYWYLSNLSKTVPASGFRLFVSIETAGKGSITANKTVQMKVPVLSDGGTIGQFDLGDTGLFLSGARGTGSGILNPNTQTIWVSNYDTSAPKTVITDPQDGATITTSSYKIMGAARDQGGSTLASVKILISSGGMAGSWTEVTSTGTNYSTWEFNWTGIADGAYTIKTEGVDWLGNAETAGAGTTVTVDQTTLTAPSANLSNVSVLPTTLPADGAQKATVSVTVKNSAGSPLSLKTVSLSSSRMEDKIKIIKETTGSDGLAVFEVSSTSAGDSILTVRVGTVELTAKPAITFTAVAFHAGDLIRGTGATVYYFGADGKKYVFPASAIYFSWYSDFSSVKIISDLEIASKPLGGNVTVRPGKLVQLVSMDRPWRVMDTKVYAVSRGGTLRWIKTPEVAQIIFGMDWEKKIIALPEVFVANYSRDSDISTAQDYNLAAEQAVATIGQDKELD